MKYARQALRSLRYAFLTIIFSIVAGLVLKVFFIQIYEISSISMEPTLLQGDFIVVNKLSAGARLLDPIRYFKQKKTEYFRMPSLVPLKKNDICVFNWPWYDAPPNEAIFGECIVKRCHGLPGSTVSIKRDRTGEPKTGDVLFPHDSTLNWSLDNFGPLYVPAKEESLILSKRKVYWYKDILLYENPGGKIEDSTFIINNRIVLNYTFKHNYYFMLGDNFYKSRDSRYWGFVPDDNIIGKAVLILFSTGDDGFRWNRLFRKI